MFTFYFDINRAAITNNRRDGSCHDDDVLSTYLSTYLLSTYIKVPSLFLLMDLTWLVPAMCV